MIANRYSLLLALLCSASPLFAQNDDTARVREQELEAVREQISELKKSLDRRAAEKDRLSTDLQEAEVRIAETRTQLKDIERRRAISQRKKDEIDGRMTVHRQQLEQEMAMLETQVRAAYTSGRQERVKLLLNQHDPATLGRLLTYYRYFSDYRGANIENVNTIIDELSVLQQAAAAEQQKLDDLLKERYAQLTELNTAQENRQGLLASLNQRIDEEGSQVERLAEQERDLSRLIAELTSILSDYPISSEEPFTRLKGRLTWPVAGNLIHDFGQPRASSSVKWNGVVLAAQRGREVRAVYHGRVVFADWLAGMGLLIIVDHGEGYMTLYGYNETTLKTAGDWVAPGDAIATVGDSGGQAEPALYFELRQGTTPVNPRGWFSRRPKS